MPCGRFFKVSGLGGQCRGTLACPCEFGSLVTRLVRSPNGEPRRADRVLGARCGTPSVARPVPRREKRVKDSFCEARATIGDRLNHSIKIGGFVLAKIGGVVLYPAPSMHNF